MGEPMTSERLGNYIKLKAEVDHYLERVARMKSEEQFAPMKESDGSQHTPGASDRMANAIIRRMNYQEKMAPRISANLDEMEAIEKAIDALEDPMERNVLRLRYTEKDAEGAYRHPKWRDIALCIYKGDEEKHLLAAQRVHREALKNITKEITIESLYCRKDHRG